jgi:peptidoglycan L-alanyl-D-glutamate endopeptidase CwlK
MIDSRDIKELHPKVQLLCNQFITKCKEYNIDVIITSTYRDNEKQSALYKLGRTEPGKRVTNANAGQSMHNYRLAFDFVPLVDGKAEWNNTLLFIKCGQIGKSLGLKWGGDFKSIKDMPHFEWTNGLTLLDLQNGKKVD